ncbi:MAG: hypothetical protein CMC86_06815 [Flavobacteriaceae bacterium]|nr:hypothetical protein [Flavobacteriaceae bacterium]|tara:strand:- start:3655 stop:4068 length:414 start_codon:yes stop_codon:yes gene_type:complete
MSLKKILAISKKPGLYKLINQSRGGYVVESMIDSKKRFVMIDESLSLLSEISIYTLEDELPLMEVFKKIFIKEQGKATTVSPKSSNEDLESYFFSVLPNFDEDRVYSSDIKKILSWYNLLLNDGFDFKQPVINSKNQ